MVDLPKFAENIKSDAFIRKVFTPAEIAVCEAAVNPLQCYAGKFAVKEAFMKAIGKGIRQEIWFTQIEVLEDERGKLSIRASGKAAESVSGGGEIKVSLSHSHTMSVAIVLIENKKI